MSFSARYLLLLPLIAVMLSGCVKRKDRSGELKGIKTVDLHLTCKHTQAPDLVITVPEGFVDSWTEEAQYDKFLIFNPADSGETQRGIIVLDVTSQPIWSIRDTAKFDRSRGSLAGLDVDWREMKDQADTNAIVYQREMIQRELFSKLHAPDGTGELALHALIAGSDPKLVQAVDGSSGDDQGPSHEAQSVVKMHERLETFAMIFRALLTLLLLILSTRMVHSQIPSSELSRSDSLYLENLIATSYPNRPFAGSARLRLLGRLQSEDDPHARELLIFMDRRHGADSFWLAPVERLLAETLLVDTLLVDDRDHIVALLAGSERVKEHPTIDDQLIQRERELLRASAAKITLRFDEYGPSQEQRRFFNLLVNHLLVKGYRARAALNDLVERFAKDYPTSWRVDVARRYFERPYDEADLGGAFGVAYTAGRFDGSPGKLFDAFYGPVLGGELYLYRVTIAGSLTIGVATAAAEFSAGGEQWAAGKSSFINGSLDVGYELRFGRLGITPLVGLGLQSARGPGDEEMAADILPRTGNRLGFDAGLILGYRIPFDIGPSIDLRIRLGRTSTALGDYDPMFNGALYAIQIGFALVQRPYRNGL